MGRDPKTAAATAIVDREKSQAEQRDLELHQLHNFGVMAGRFQAFKAIGLIAEFLSWKQVAQMIDNKEHLKLPGVNNLQDYFEQLGIKPSNAYNNLKIARTLEPDELQTLERIGLTRRDLLGYASLPEDKRLEIKEGKVINLETASRDEICDLIEQVVAEAHEADSTIRAKEKVLKDKEAVINKQAKALAKYEQDAEAKGLTPDEDAFLQQIENTRLSFFGYMDRIDPAMALSQYDDVTPRMRAALISMHHYMRQLVLAAYDTAIETHGSPVMNPEVLEDYERWMADHRG